MLDPAGTSTQTTESIPAMSQKAIFRFLEGAAGLVARGSVTTAATYPSGPGMETFQKTKSPFDNPGELAQDRTEIALMTKAALLKGNPGS
jgi:hypothetical protein